MRDCTVSLRIVAITYNRVQAGAYALILSEENGNRRVSIVIGTPEAQSISLFLEGLIPPRPLTHDLFVSFAKSLKINPVRLNIYRYEEGIFYSELVFEQKGEVVRLDARTSDAIALALRFNLKIHISEEVMNQVGTPIPEDDIFCGSFKSTEEKETTSPLDYSTLEDLQDALDEAILEEDYEKASRLRDIINEIKNRPQI